jgi:hypothetical protein
VELEKKMMNIELEAQYDDHRSQAQFAKEEYYRKKEKAVKNIKKGNVSMIVDSAGGSGTTLAPRYSTTEKNEPVRHEMCMIKSTIIEVHGVGTKVVVTIPKLEKQGCNLTFECVLEGLLFLL